MNGFNGNGNYECEPKEELPSPMQDDTIFNETEEADVLYTDESKPEFLYGHMTLEEIIQLKRAADGHIGQAGRGGVRYGTDDTGGTRLTPVLLLRILSEDAKLFEMEAEELEIGKTNMNDFRAHRWRVTWTHCKVEGIAEAPRKMMAKQVAAFDLLEKMRIQFPAYNLPDCYIPAGALVNPFLFRLLDSKCEQMGIAPAEFQLKASLNFKGKKEFTALCFIEDDVFVGKSFDPVYAKRFSVSKAYEALTGFKYPPDRVIRGDQCFRNQDKNYQAVESEATHVYVCYKRPEKRLRMSPRVSRSESVISLNGSSDSSIVFRPPRLRPPPIIIPPHLKINLQAVTAAGQPARPSQLSNTAEAMIFGEDPLTEEEDNNDLDSIEIEPPEKYGELSDDEDEPLGVDIQGVEIEG